jgi:flagellar protein FlaG
MRSSKHGHECQVEPDVPFGAAPGSSDGQGPAGGTCQGAGGCAPEDKPHTREDLEKAVGDIRDFVQSSQRKLDFSIDDSTGQVVVKVIATESGDVIRQLPSETALKLAQSLSEAGSLLFDGKA